MKTTVGTSAVALPVDVGDQPAVQNLGPGTVYLDTKSTVTTGDGFRLAVNETYEWPKDLAKALYAVSDTAGTDVRTMVVG